MKFTSYDGEKIWYEVHRPENPRAVIQIMTGLAETHEYYEEFADRMSEAGFAVALSLPMVTAICFGILPAMGRRCVKSCGRRTRDFL